MEHQSNRHGNYNQGGGGGALVAQQQQQQGRPVGQYPLQQQQQQRGQSMGHRPGGGGRTAPSQQQQHPPGHAIAHDEQNADGEQQQQQRWDDAPEHGGPTLDADGSLVGFHNPTLFNGAPRPPPLAETIFSYGLLEYAKPPPGMETPWAIHHYSDVMPHIPYLSYAEPVPNSYRGRMVYKRLYNGANWPLICKMSVPGDRGMRSPWGLQRPREVPGEGIDPYARSMTFCLDHPEHRAFFEGLDARNDEVGAARVDPWFNEGKKPNARDRFLGSDVAKIYTPAVKLPEDETKGYAPTVKIKFTIPNPAKPKQQLTKVYRSHGVIKKGDKLIWDVEEVHYSELEKPNQTHAITFNDGGIYFIQGKAWGNTYRLTKVIILSDSAGHGGDGDEDMCCRKPGASSSSSPFLPTQGGSTPPRYDVAAAEHDGQSAGCGGEGEGDWNGGGGGGGGGGDYPGEGEGMDYYDENGQPYQDGAP